MASFIENTFTGTLARLKKPLTLHQAATTQLREAIVTGELKPGAALKDGELAAQLGLSATPVREALVQLSAEGLVEIQPNRSKRVMPIDHQAMVELLQVHNELWVLGYTWGCPRVGPAEIERLKQINIAHRDAIAEGNHRETVLAAYAFHLVFMEASGNRELARLSVDRLPLIERYILLACPEIISMEMNDRHRAVLDALEAGDVQAVIAIYKTFNELVLRAAMARLDKTGA